MASGGEPLHGDVDRRRRAVVTGAGQGIGAAVASRFLEQGWDVDGWDLRPGDEGRVRWSTVDVADADSVAAAATVLDRVDAVVNCAAIATLGTILDIDPDDWSRTLAINVGGSFNVARALYPALRRAGGVLILVGSVNARNTTTRRGAYSASKAAVVSLTQTIAVEWALAEAGIRVLCVSPGLTRTAQATMRIEIGSHRREDALPTRPVEPMDHPGRDRLGDRQPGRERVLRPARGERRHRRRLRRVGWPLLMPAPAYAELREQVVVVTGAGRGIGRAVAHRVRRAGMRSGRQRPDRRRRRGDRRDVHASRGDVIDGARR